MISSTRGFAGIAVSACIPGSDAPQAKQIAGYASSVASPGSFDAAVECLPEEKPYAYHKKLSGDAIHTWKRNAA